MVLLGRFDGQKRPGAARLQTRVTVGSLVLQAIPGSVASVWYQPETKRVYIAGQVTLSATGATIENDALVEQGLPLHLNAAK